MKIGLIDPALYDTQGTSSPNLGDQIISRAVRRELRDIFGEPVEIVATPSHAFPTPATLKLLKDAQYVFVGGSNLLYFRALLPASWKIGPFGLAGYRNLVLMGCGWGSYQIRPNLYGRMVSRLILSPKMIHSVRDDYTCGIAREGLAVPHVVNTACPTMWSFTPSFIQVVRRTRAKKCIFSLTDYSKNPETDGALITNLRRFYGDDLLFWPQGVGDLDYARALGYDGRVIERTLPAFLNLLSSGEEYDYVGTRLHAGILCLEHGVRALIVAIDNKAKEIGVDTGLPTIARGDSIALAQWIEGDAVVPVRIPLEAINTWRRQFKTTGVGDVA